MEKKIFEVIKTSDGYFLQNAQGFKFDGEYPESTWKQNWYKVKSIQNIEKVIPEVKTVMGYKLNDEFTPSESMPSRVVIDFFGENMYDNKLFYLYSPEIETTTESSEPIEFEIKIIAELEGELVQSKINFPVYGKYPNTDGKNWSITNSQITIGLVDDIITPEILKQEVPCELSSELSYKIIRTYIKDNINPKVAEISSDYDFCLTVSKKIPLEEKEACTIDANFNIFGKRKKPKFVTKYRVERKKEIYAIAPRIKGEVYRGYKEAPIFRGENTKNLQKNIDDYLEVLINEINKPIKDCPCCKGFGVVGE